MPFILLPFRTNFTRQYHHHHHRRSTAMQATFSQYLLSLNSVARIFGKLINFFIQADPPWVETTDNHRNTSLRTHIHRRNSFSHLTTKLFLLYSKVEVGELPDVCACLSQQLWLSVINLHFVCCCKLVRFNLVKELTSRSVLLFRLSFQRISASGGPLSTVNVYK